MAEMAKRRKEYKAFQEAERARREEIQKIEKARQAVIQRNEIISDWRAALIMTELKIKLEKQRRSQQAEDALKNEQRTLWRLEEGKPTEPKGMQKLFGRTAHREAYEADMKKWTTQIAEQQARVTRAKTNLKQAEQAAGVTDNEVVKRLSAKNPDLVKQYKQIQEEQEKAAKRAAEERKQKAERQPEQTTKTEKEERQPSKDNGWER